ncbi:MAG: 3-isopropylmalate dehydratase large subunit [Deltaproteobacteria bacterium]|nr:3-isopropylmalate dehydratase large subunit [Deltaproteobacteria bacterium]
MTIGEKILAAHAGRKSVRPGEFINVKVDLVMAHDLTGGIAIQEFRKTGYEKVFDPSKVVLVLDHYVPNKDVLSAEHNAGLRKFAREQGIVFFPEGRGGIEHVILPEKGLVLPGQVVVGADSHTCTYGALGAFSTGMGSTDIAVAMATGEIWMKVPPTIKFVYNGKLPEWIGGKDLILLTIGRIGVDGALYSVMEFRGDALKDLSMDGRFTMANMAIEAGGKAGIFPVDEKTIEYVKGRTDKPYEVFDPEPDDEYSQIIEFDVSNIEPQVSMPHSPDNVSPVSKLSGVEIDQAVIGSCTNGRLEDLRIAAGILKGNSVHPGVRCIVIPGSQQVYLDAVHEGLIDIFINAGAAVSTPTCGPCVGGYMGVLAAGEKCISTTNRNFLGRMGSPKSEVYLSSPAVAAASALTGRITAPKEVIK